MAESSDDWPYISVPPGTLFVPDPEPAVVEDLTEPAPAISFDPLPIPVSDPPPPPDVEVVDPSIPFPFEEPVLLEGDMLMGRGDLGLEGAAPQMGEVVVFDRVVAEVELAALQEAELVDFDPEIHDLELLPDGVTIDDVLAGRIIRRKRLKGA